MDSSDNKDETEKNSERPASTVFGTSKRPMRNAKVSQAELDAQWGVET